MRAGPSNIFSILVALSILALPALFRPIKSLLETSILTDLQYNAAPHAPVAQLDRVPGYEPGGREFESLRARHINYKGPFWALCNMARRGSTILTGSKLGALKRARRALARDGERQSPTKS